MPLTQEPKAPVAQFRSTQPLPEPIQNVLPVSPQRTRPQAVFDAGTQQQAEHQDAFPTQGVTAKNPVPQRPQLASPNGYTQPPQGQFKNQAKALPQVYRPTPQARTSYVYSAGLFSDPASAKRKMEAAEMATNYLSLELPNRSLRVQATNDSVQLTGLAANADQSRRIEQLVREKVKAAYQNTQPEKVVTNLLSVASKPVIAVSSVVIQQTGTVDWKDDFLKNSLFGALTRPNKNPILTLSTEREARVREQATDTAFEVIARPQLRIRSESTGSLQVSLGGKGANQKILSLAVTVLASTNGNVHYSIKG